MNEERFNLTKKAGIYGIAGNIFLLVIKAITGFVFNFCIFNDFCWK